MGSFGEYFLFYGLMEFIYAYSSALKALSSSSYPRFFPLSLPGIWREIRPHLFTRTSVPKLIFLFPISADGRRGLFPLWDSSQLFSFYLLPSPVRRFVWATICPCTPFFTHSVTEYKHLLVSILTWICYLRNWPKFLFQWSVLGLLIQTPRNSSNSLFLFSQQETTWHNLKLVNLVQTNEILLIENSTYLNIRFEIFGWICMYI